MDNQSDKNITTILGQILLKLNLGQSTITVGDIMRITEANPNSHFYTWNRRDVQRVLSELEQLGFLVEKEEGVYGITVDVCSFREYILSVSEQSAPEQETADAVALDEILDKDWSVKEAQEAEDGESEEAPESEQGENKDDDDDPFDLDSIFDDDDDDGSGDADSGDADSGFKDFASAVLDEVKRSIDIQVKRVEGEESRLIVSVGALCFANQLAEFEISRGGPWARITDRGVTLKAVGKQLALDADGVWEEIEDVMEYFGVSAPAAQLTVYVASPYEVLEAIMSLYAAMEEIYHIDAAAISARYQRNDDLARCQQLVSQLATENESIDRVQTIERLKEMLSEAMQGGQYAQVYDYAFAIRALAAMSDEKFAASREDLFAEEDDDEDWADFDPFLFDDDDEDASEASDGERSDKDETPVRAAGESGTKFLVGMDEDYEIYADLKEEAHVLVGGTAGAGKSTFLHTVISGLITKNSPRELRLILIDLKRSEFTKYEGLPHLLTGKIITDVEPALNALTWAIGDMERRYELFYRKSQQGRLITSVDAYNEVCGEEERLPRIVIVIDEFADFMDAERRGFQNRVLQLLQKSRAAGIYLVLATQRLSVDVLTGLLTSNILSRIVFRTKSELDSRVALGMTGAEELRAAGELLFKSALREGFVRAKGVRLEEKTIEKRIAEAKTRFESYFNDDVIKAIHGAEEPPQDEKKEQENAQEVPHLYITALALVVKLGQVSISLIQRKCGIGYNVSGKIVEWMEAMGYVSPFDGTSRARQVLITREEFEKKYGPLE